MGCCHGCPAGSSGDEQCFSFQLWLSPCLLLGCQEELPVPLIHGNTSSLPDGEGDALVLTAGWKWLLCAAQQARGSGFAAEILSLGFPLHLWLLSLQLSVALARQTPVCGQWLCLVSVFLAKANFLFILMDYLNLGFAPGLCLSCSEVLVLRQLKSEHSDGFGAAGVWVCHGPGLVWTGQTQIYGLWHTGVYPSACGSGTAGVYAPSSLGPRRMLQAHGLVLRCGFAVHWLFVPWDSLQPLCAWCRGCPSAPQAGGPLRGHFPWLPLGFVSV